MSGYVGSAILKEFLIGEGKGKYCYRCSVRDASNKTKLQPLINYFGKELIDSIEWVSADVLDAE